MVHGSRLSPIRKGKKICCYLLYHPSIHGCVSGFTFCKAPVEYCKFFSYFADSCALKFFDEHKTNINTRNYILWNHQILIN